MLSSHQSATKTRGLISSSECVSDENEHIHAYLTAPEKLQPGTTICTFSNVRQTEQPSSDLFVSKLDPTFCVNLSRCLSLPTSCYHTLKSARSHTEDMQSKEIPVPSLRHRFALEMLPSSPSPELRLSVTDLESETKVHTYSSESVNQVGATSERSKRPTPEGILDSIANDGVYHSSDTSFLSPVHSVSQTVSRLQTYGHSAYESSWGMLHSSPLPTDSNQNPVSQKSCIHSQLRDEKSPGSQHQLDSVDTKTNECTEHASLCQAETPLTDLDHHIQTGNVLDFANANDDPLKWDYAGDLASVQLTSATGEPVLWDTCAEHNSDQDSADKVSMDAEPVTLPLTWPSANKQRLSACLRHQRSRVSNRQSHHRTYAIQTRFAKCSPNRFTTDVSFRAVSHGSFISSPEPGEDDYEDRFLGHEKHLSLSGNLYSLRSESPLIPLTDGILDALESDEEAINSKECPDLDPAANLSMKNSEKFDPTNSNTNITQSEELPLSVEDRVDVGSRQSVERSDIEEIYLTTSQSMTKLRQHADCVLRATESVDREFRKRLDNLSISLDTTTIPPEPRQRTLKMPDSDATKPELSPGQVSFSSRAPPSHFCTCNESHGEEKPSEMKMALDSSSWASSTSNVCADILTPTNEVQSFARSNDLLQLGLCFSSDDDKVASNQTVENSVLQSTSRHDSHDLLTPRTNSPQFTDPTFFSAVTNVTPIPSTSRTKTGDFDGKNLDSKRSSIIVGNRQDIQETEKGRFLWDAWDPMKMPTDHLESLTQPPVSQPEADTLVLNSVPPHHSGRFNTCSSAAPYGDVNRVQSLPDALDDLKRFRSAEREYNIPVHTLNHPALISCRSESDLLNQLWCFRKIDESTSTFRLSTIDVQSRDAGDRAPVQTYSCSERVALNENGANSHMLSQTCNSSNRMESPDLSYTSTRHSATTENHTRERLSNLGPLPDQPLHMKQNKTLSSLSLAGPMATSTRVPSLLSDSSERAVRSDLEPRDMVPVLTTRPPVARRRSQSQCDPCIKLDGKDKIQDVFRTFRNERPHSDGQCSNRVNKKSVPCVRPFTNFSEIGNKAPKSIRDASNAHVSQNRHNDQTGKKYPGEISDCYVASQLRYLLLKHRLKLSRAKDAYHLRRRVVDQLQTLLKEVSLLQKQKNQMMSLPADWDTDTSSLLSETTVSEQCDQVDNKIDRGPSGLHANTFQVTTDKQSHLMDSCNEKQTMMVDTPSKYIAKLETRSQLGQIHGTNRDKCDIDSKLNGSNYSEQRVSSRCSTECTVPVACTISESHKETRSRLCDLRERAEQQLAEMLTILNRKKSRLPDFTELTKANKKIEDSNAPLPPPPSRLSWTVPNCCECNHIEPINNSDANAALKLTDARASQGGLTWFQPFEKKVLHNKTASHTNRIQSTLEQRRVYEFSNGDLPVDGKNSVCGGDSVFIEGIKSFVQDNSEPEVPQTFGSLVRSNNMSDPVQLNSVRQPDRHNPFKKIQDSVESSGNRQILETCEPQLSVKRESVPSCTLIKQAHSPQPLSDDEFDSLAHTSESFLSGLIATPRGVKFYVPTEISNEPVTQTYRLYEGENLATMGFSSQMPSVEIAVHSNFPDDLQTRFQQRMSRWISRSRERQKRIKLASENRRYTRAMNDERAHLFGNSSKKCSPVRMKVQGQNRYESELCFCPRGVPRKTHQSIHSSCHCCSANITRHAVEPIPDLCSPYFESPNKVNTRILTRTNSSRPGEKFRTGKQHRPAKIMTPREQQRHALESKLSQLRANRLRMKIYGEKVLHSVLQRRGPWSSSFREI
ncbi:hypothetical protein PHET_00483 [Paragonimus heterotremus]|uniref:ALMS motif domain-containing protein n=1 Tax=Paragonimus heterotremus TaxID=100268 RepID=A0A8J4TPU7_9TREM|nr:hypothetical protein PHET_00483 [Paragonimus heterotremus]